MITRTGRIPLDAVVYETKHYPRVKPTTSHIEKYVDDLSKGDVFPPIRLLDGTNSLIDGYHRWKAHIQYRNTYPLLITEYEDGGFPAPTNDIACEWHTLPEDATQLLYASGLQNKTGLAKSEADNRDAARRSYLAQEGISKSVLEKYIGVSRKKLSEYLSDLEAKHEETLHHLLLRFALLGWTEREMVEAVEKQFPDAKGNSRPTFDRILAQNGTVDKMGQEFSTSNHPVEMLAKRQDMPLVLAWAFKLTGCEDQDRLQRLSITLQPYDVWTFSKCEDLFGTEWPGRIPGQLVAHVLYFFTQPGDMVIDPMAGSGTTVDVCLAFNRNCYAYDLNTTHGRPDILPHNIQQDGWPERTKKADLLFWDPPYFDKKDAQYADGSISALERGPYLDFFTAQFQEAYALVKKGTRLAFLMSDWNDDAGDIPLIGRWEYAQLMADAGWTITRVIDCPLSTQLVHPDIVEKFRKSRRLARLNRSLLIGEKR